MLRLVFAICFFVLGAVTVFGGDDPPSEAPAVEPNPGSIRGVVRSTEGRPVSWILVHCLDEQGERHYVGVTGEDGRFGLDGLSGESATLYAYIYGDPSAGEPITREVRVGTHDLVLVVDLGEQLVVRAEKGGFVPGDGLQQGVIYVGGYPPSGAHLYVEDGERTLRWTPTIEGGALRFRRIRTGLSWTLYIPYSAALKGTYLGSGPRLEAGERTVKLEPGQRITGTVEGVDRTVHRSGSGTSPNGIVARCGPVEVRISPSLFFFGKGRFAFPLLPAGRWEVSAFNIEEERGCVAGTVVAEAGDDVIIDMTPSEEAYRRARRHGP